MASLSRIVVKFAAADFFATSGNIGIGWDLAWQKMTASKNFPKPASSPEFGSHKVFPDYAGGFGNRKVTIRSEQDRHLGYHWAL
jgi:hypothetical protein